MSKLIDELKTVNDWYTLGIYLGLSIPILKKVKEDNTTADTRLSDMLHRWLQSDSRGTWEDVVSALRKMDENCVADHIKETYCGEAVGAHTVAEGNTIIYYYARNNSYSCMLIDILNSLLKILQIYLGEQQRSLQNGNDSAYEIF